LDRPLVGEKAHGQQNRLVRQRNPHRFGSQPEQQECVDAHRRQVGQLKEDVAQVGLPPCTGVSRLDRYSSSRSPGGATPAIDPTRSPSSRRIRITPRVCRLEILTPSKGMRMIWPRVLISISSSERSSTIFIPTISPTLAMACWSRV